MSASREKQNRQEQASSGWVDPKTVREAEQRKKEKRSNLLYGVIALVFVVVAVASIIYRSNIIPKLTTAATIDGEKYSVAEVDFYYQNALRGFQNDAYYVISYLGLNTQTSLKEQTISEDAASMMATMGLGEAEAGQTWFDFILDKALTQMAQVQNGLKAAEAEGFVYPAGVQAQYEDSMSSLKTAAQTSGVSVNQYLANVFGNNLLTEKVYGEQLLRMMKLDAYAGAYAEGLTYDTAKLEETYKADPQSYDKVNFASVTISGAAEKTKDADGNDVDPTEEESAAAMAAAKEAADKMLANFRAGSGDLEALATAYGDGASYASGENSAYSRLNSTVADWLFNSARKAGDTAVLESGSNYYVVLFNDRFREEYNTIDIRHILVKPSAATLSTEDEGYAEEQEQLKADAKAKADELLEQWKSGEATEDSFAALAMQESVDGSKYDGGLYTRVTQGQMVTNFNDWCFAAGRKSGDTDVVETDYGYHVMYFVGENMPAWQALVSSTLQSEDYVAWEDGLTADAVITRGESGLKYVG